MLTDKKNVLQLVALLKAYGIEQIVLSPGSRNSPLSHTFAAEPFFNCHSVVDERSAGFYALGIIQATEKPVAICCTSGSAALNYAPAVAEAYYQQLPLLIITADRPESQIGQMLGQTLPQSGLYNTLVKKAVQLPEISDITSQWHCNRLINEAIQALEHNGKGPAHINVPISEPLFNYTTEALPVVRKINSYRSIKTFENKDYIQRFAAHNKRMILIGQLPPDNELKRQLEILATQSQCIVLCEHPANIHSAVFIGNFDRLLKTLSQDEKQQYAPDLLITMGGHIISKRINQLIQQYPPREHWHISETGEITDPYRHLTDIIECDRLSFTGELIKNQTNATEESRTYFRCWKQASEKMAAYRPKHPEDTAVQLFMQAIPSNCSLQLANSTSVRYAQLFPVKNNIKVFCNRGTSGIEGSLSTAVGYASVSNQPTYLLTGDLSFFYDMNGLWNRQLSNKLRILLINNGRGEIFYTLKGLNQSHALADYIAATHYTTAKGWAESLGILYLSASSPSELEKQLPVFIGEDHKSAVLLEYLCDNVKY